MIRQTIWALYLTCSGTRKKRPASQVFFSYRPFGRCPSVSAHLAKVLLCTQNVCKKVTLALWSVLAPTLQLLTISLAILFFQTPLDRQGMASLQSNSTFSFKHHLTGEAWPACRAQKKKTRFAGLFFLTGLRPVLPLGRCCPSVSAHRANRIRCSSNC